MRKLFLIILFHGSFLLGIPQQITTPRVMVMNFNQFEPYLHWETDTLYLINFWATWCTPCREELPAIEEVGMKYSLRKFKIILVSLDFPNQLENRLKPFIRDKKLNSTVILLDDPNQNRWIDKVDTSWSGEIPFSILYKRHSRESFPQTFTYNQLDSIINVKINQP